MNASRNFQFDSLLVLLFLGSCAAAIAAPSPRTSNVQVVKTFYAEGNKPAKAAALFATDAIARTDPTQPPIKGSQAIAGALKGLTANGGKLTAHITSTYAAGPIVVVRHVDSITSPGEKPQVYKLVAVFVLKSGKISEWSEYGEE